jgi:tetratricopeptide (TPR) repeat protein
MISSTALDLPEHRQQASDACLRMTMFPLAMEQMPASPDDALTLSRKYVDQADFYLGIFAFRYGTVPDGHKKSITELEYDRAIERGIPTFIFIAHDNHPPSPGDVDTGPGADRLRLLKERLGKAHKPARFRSPEELRTEIIHALSPYRQDDTRKLHYVAEIPPPPAPWVAHWYSLLGNRPLVGRRAELNLLTGWVADPASAAYISRLFVLVAIGGMGKTALAWTWWNKIAPTEMRSLAGRMWWSFYESGARLENFTAGALAYLKGEPRAVTEKLPPHVREDELIAILDREPYLVVLDGLERELVAYGRIDAAHLADEDLDAKTAHTIGQRAGPPASGPGTFMGDAKLRQTADPRTGHFLRRLTQQVRASRILVTTRLFPYELEDFNGMPLSGTYVQPLLGLSDDDALALWNSAGIGGARDALVRLFRSFGGHPLLVRALAGKIALDRRNPGDFDKWREGHADFDPFTLPLVQRKSRVLEYALQGLTSEELTLLQTTAGFRMPAAYETLAALLVGADRTTRPFPREESLDRALADLDDRGLVGWDRRANRYDLHPIVRGVAWSRGDDSDRQAIAELMRAYFAPIPRTRLSEVERLEDVAPAIELYVSLVRLGRFDEALVVYKRKLHTALLDRLSVPRQQIELLEMLFPDGIEQSARLGGASDQSFTLYSLALAYGFSGQPTRAVSCWQRAEATDLNDPPSLARDLRNASASLRMMGKLHDAEASAFRALEIGRAQRDENAGVSLGHIALSRATCGLDDGDRALDQVRAVWQKRGDRFREGFACAHLAQSALWRGQHDKAAVLAKRSWELARTEIERYSIERYSIRAARLEGEAALGLGDLDKADERLHDALTRARAGNVEEELAALIALATLNLRRGDMARAREHLDQVWDVAERGPYPLLHADAKNILAEIEIKKGNRAAAMEATTAAYRLAWCDGPPFAYDYGFRAAGAHLRALGAPEPVMPPYDAPKHEPIEEIDLGPEDE